MGTGDRENREPTGDAYERVLDGIYALLDDDGNLPDLLNAVDGLFGLPASKHELEQQSSRMASLLIHARRANTLLEQFNRLHLSSRHTGRVLDHIPMGIVLIRPDTRIVSVNSRARALLAHIGADHEGKLRFSKATDHKRLLDAIRQVTDGRSQGASIRMGEMNAWISHFGSSADEQLGVYIGHQTFARNIRLDQLMSMYGLTDKEARLTAQLCNGHASLEEASEAMGISLSTARTHLKHVFSKTGAQRQADLVKMVLVNPILTLQNTSQPPQTGQQSGEASQLVRLPSGRTLSWAEYGDPKGRPVLLCHAITGCRLMLPSDTSLLKEHHIRMIVPDRSGYGFSSPTEEDRMQQWLEDSRHFMHYIGLSSFAVMGHSAGGAYAMMLAATFPEAVEHLHLVSSVAPLGNMANSRHLPPVNRMLLHLCLSNPEAARELIQLSMQVALKKPDSYFSLIINTLTENEQARLETAGIRQQLTRVFSETTRQGTAHMVEELMYLSRDWRINARKITCPVSIWHGQEDTHSPFILMERFSRKLRSCARRNWMLDSDHYLLFHHWPAIVKSLRD